MRRSDIIDAVVVGSWRRFVFTVDPAPADGELVDLRAYVLCVLDGLYRALRRRDVYAVGSVRWGDPRANLLDGPDPGSGRVAGLRREEVAAGVAISHDYYTRAVSGDRRRRRPNFRPTALDCH